jgi:hypothetical protein
MTTCVMTVGANNMDKKQFETEDELWEWHGGMYEDEPQNNVGYFRCPVCDGKAFEGSMFCMDHKEKWDAGTWTHRGEMVKWVNENREFKPLEETATCAECEGPCPADDYLCESCRE